MQFGALREHVRVTRASHKSPTVEPFLLECPATTEVDSRLLTVLNDALQKTGHLPLRRLDLEIHDRQVVVRGIVPTYYLKQLAQGVIRELAPDCEILNLVEVAGSACPGLLCAAIRRHRTT